MGFIGFRPPLRSRAKGSHCRLRNDCDRLVKSLAHPGGNITGISLLSPELEGKRQDILIEAVPGARRMAMPAEANATGPQQLKALQDADSGTDRLRDHLLSGAFIPGSSQSKARPARRAGRVFLR